MEHQWLRSTWGHVVVLVISIAIVAVAAGAAIWAFGKPVTLVLILSAGLAVVTAEEVIRQGLSRRSTSIPPDLQDQEGSRAFASFYGVRIQLRAALEDGEQAERYLVPAVAELADDLLLRNHGIDRTRREEQARQLLGDELYSLITGSPHQTVDANAVERMVTRLEGL